MKNRFLTEVIRERQRIALFIGLAKMQQAITSTMQRLNFKMAGNIVWRSKKRNKADTDALTGYFLLGINLSAGKQIILEIPTSHWRETDFADTLEMAPKYDGHSDEDIIQRLEML